MLELYGHAPASDYLFRKNTFIQAVSDSAENENSVLRLLFTFENHGKFVPLTQAEYF